MIDGVAATERMAADEYDGVKVVMIFVLNKNRDKVLLFNRPIKEDGVKVGEELATSSGSYALVGNAPDKAAGIEVGHNFGILDILPRRFRAFTPDKDNVIEKEGVYYLEIDEDYPREPTKYPTFWKLIESFSESDKFAFDQKERMSDLLEWLKTKPAGN